MSIQEEYSLREEIDRLDKINASNHYFLEDLACYILGAPGYNKEVAMLALNNWSKRCRDIREEYCLKEHGYIIENGKVSDDKWCKYTF